MAAPRRNPKRARIALCVEPLEDRYLLSPAAVANLGIVAAPASNSAEVHSPSPSSPSQANDSASHQTGSQPSSGFSTANLPQQGTRTGLPNQGGLPSSESSANANVVGGLPQEALKLATGAIANLQALLCVPPAPAAVGPTVRDTDDDYNPSDGRDDDAHDLLNPASFDSLLAASVVNAGLSSGAWAGSAALPIKPANLLSTPEPLGTSTWGSMGFVGAAVSLPANQAVPSLGSEREHLPDGEESEPLPQELTPRPFLLPPPDAVPEKTVPLSLSPLPLAEFFPLDAEALQQRTDAFFEQLARLSEEWHDGRLIHRITPWLLAGGVVAYEWIRLRRLRATYLAGSEEDREMELTVFPTGGEE